LHFANVDLDLPYEFRWLGDNSVTEGFAFTFEQLMLEDGWLARHTTMEAQDRHRYRYHAFRNLLFMIRRYAAKFSYELQLHDSKPLAGKSAIYTETLEDALGIRHYPEYWLFDMDGGFYSAQYLRAWIFAAQLRKHLRADFGPEYYLNPESGKAFKKLWRLGQQLPVQELAQSLGFGGLDVGPLIGELEAALNTPVRR
jgi:hypothetical protein